MEGMIVFMYLKKIYNIILAVLLVLSSCSSLEKINADTELINDKNEVKPIDIEAPFFRMVRPWREGVSHRA
jgi:PBP1b-binding outer membrane lipoprotein LpoB